MEVWIRSYISISDNLHLCRQEAANCQNFTPQLENDHPPLWACKIWVMFIMETNTTGDLLWLRLIFSYHFLCPILWYFSSSPSIKAESLMQHLLIQLAISKHISLVILIVKLCIFSEVKTNLEKWYQGNIFSTLPWKKNNTPINMPALGDIQSQWNKMSPSSDEG